MPTLSSLTTSLLLSSALVWFGTACGAGILKSSSESDPRVTPDQSHAVDSISPADQDAAPGASEAASTEQAPSSSNSDPYPEAINRASSAFNLSQSAQSQDDWRLVASRWQQAIDLMASVPVSSTNHATAQSKVSEYRRNLSFAQQQASQSVPSSVPAQGRVIAVAPDGSTSPLTPLAQSSASRSSNTNNSQSARSPASGRVFQAPITRRAGGTPIIQVTFNGNQTFEMIVDTGASGTVITQPMAAALGVVPVGQTRVATASTSGVTFLLGRVNSVEVDGAVSRNVVVAIAGPELSTGLLGHDFFGNYDVTVRRDVVEFRER
ncbi:MAG: retropepsin-like aspartic protease family protein [Elainellaceae cyanobacterium]